MLPDVIISWAASKGLQIANKKMESAIMEYLDGPSLGDLVRETEQTAINQISLMYNAPYKEALMHLRSENIDLAEPMLVKAIGHNQLDLSAWILYLGVLRSKRKYTIVLDYCLDLLKIFGFQRDLAPAPIYQQYVKQYFNRNILPGAEVEIRFPEEYFPENIWCSPTGIVVRCKWTGASLGWVISRLSPTFAIFGFTWANKRNRNKTNQALISLTSYYDDEGASDMRKIFEVYKSNPTVYALTERYAIIEVGKKYIAYGLEDGFKMPQEYSREEIEEIFPTPNENLERRHARTNYIPRIGWSYATGPRIDGSVDFSYGGLKFAYGQYRYKDAQMGQWGGLLTISRS